jgi:hypothetical protein
LVNRIEDEAACEEEDRELGRVFIKEIESQIELLEQNAPSVPWFIMKRYLTDFADDREAPLPLDTRMAHSFSVRLSTKDKPADDDEFDLMDNFKARLKSRLEAERSTTLNYELQRGQTDGEPTE